MSAAARFQTNAPSRFSPTVLAGRADTGADLAAFDRVGTVVTLRRDATLFFAGDDAQFCYKVLTGAVRSCRLLADGRRHIGDFLLPGDFLGIEAGPTYSITIEAVNDATLMRYPRRAIDQLIQQQPRLAKCLLDQVCGGFFAAQAHLLLLGRKNAVERLASFLLMMSERSGEGDRVALPMTRIDIADYLGLTIETVSRIFSELKGRGVIQLESCNAVRFTRRSTLADLAEAA
jgi:CRP-like cAMP-binding protein